MSYKLIKDEYLTDIADAIRVKTDGDELYKPREMANAIMSLKSFSALNKSGQCRYAFYNNNWNVLLDNDLVTFDGVAYTHSMFESSNTLEAIKQPFMFDSSVDFNDCGDMFRGCYNLKSISDIHNLKPSDMGGMFGYCYSLRELPNFINLDTTVLHSSGQFDDIFNSCYSLRRIEPEFLVELHSTLTTNGNTITSSGFKECASLDEIEGIYPPPAEFSQNLFVYGFQECYRLKNIIFATQEDGSPYTRRWTNQNLYTNGYVGYARDKDWYLKRILNYNSGITADKRITDDTTYQALKNDLDWWTTDISYSRYNHDSAVNTINSLPDTSAYLVEVGGTNNIIFVGNAGALTDGGAINTLTEEEIAVATAKGWTVSYV